MSQFDLVIVGGGMVGASLACALRQTNLSCALIDAAPLAIASDPRLIALNHTSVCLFKNLGVWDKLQAYAEPIKQVHISERGQFGMTRLHASDGGVTTLGQVIPASHLNATLDKVLNEKSGQLKIFRPATVKSLRQHSDQVELKLTTGTGEINLSAKLVIAADGTHSTVRKELAIPIQLKDYHQSALVTTTTLQRSHQNVAYERFHPGGAIALLPLPGLQTATVWTDDKTIIENLLALSDADFLARLQQQFGYRCGKFLATATRHHYPLQQLTATKTWEQRILLIGNAAHTMHPIAAQGFNLALAEIAMLVQFLMETPLRTDWADYSHWQASRQMTSQRLSDQLPGWFQHDFLPIKLGRQLGLLALDAWAPLKTRFTRAAMGKVPNLPRLLLDHDEQ